MGYAKYIIDNGKAYTAKKREELGAVLAILDRMDAALDAVPESALDPLGGRSATSADREALEAANSRLNDVSRKIGGLRIGLEQALMPFPAMLTDIVGYAQGFSGVYSGELQQIRDAERAEEEKRERGRQYLANKRFEEELEAQLAAGEITEAQAAARRARQGIVPTPSLRVHQAGVYDGGSALHNPDGSLRK